MAADSVFHASAPCLRPWDLTSTGEELLQRLCNDQDDEDGLLRLVPDDGKEIVEFSRSKELSGAADLKVVKWGTKGVENTKYAKVVPGDIVQTFRNFVSSIVSQQVKKRMGRDGLLILLDEFDVVRDKKGLGSLIKSLTTPDVKFAICGIGRDLSDLVLDHHSVERLLEQGAIPVKPMPEAETQQIIIRAQELFKGAVTFAEGIPAQIADVAQGYPYFAQLIGKECVNRLNELSSTVVDEAVFNLVLDRLKAGQAFPTLESAYQRAIGNSKDRQLLLHFLAEQTDERTLFTDEVGRIILKEARKDAEDLDVQYIDQLIPRLVDPKYGPVLDRVPERQGVYEFVNPVLRQYIRLRTI